LPESGNDSHPARPDCESLPESGKDSDSSCPGRDSLPKAHIEFLRALPIMIDTPAVLFVHAGIDPARSIDNQQDDDLVFIRHRFIESDLPLPKLVVHGHTPVDQPDVQEMRLNLDTGAYRSDRLTVARLWQGEVRLFST